MMLTFGHRRGWTPRRKHAEEHEYRRLDGCSDEGEDDGEPEVKADASDPLLNRPAAT
jgi:hypothetical protein